MEKRHFEFIAATIRNMADRDASAKAAFAFAVACRSQNARFNSRRFLEACGVDQSEIEVFQSL